MSASLMEQDMATQPAVLAAHIHNHPAAVSLLNVLDGESRRLRPPQTAADQEGQDGPNHGSSRHWGGELIRLRVQARSSDVESAGGPIRP